MFIDKAYDTADFVAETRTMKVTQHVARNINAHRGSNIDAHTMWHARYEISQLTRERTEEANGWIKTVAGMARTLHRGVDRVAWMFQLRATAYDPVRLPRLRHAFLKTSSKALRRQGKPWYCPSAVHITGRDREDPTRQGVFSAAC